ncbi:class I SAM-dependent methyltransferase [Fluviispira multicolorata]|uniref:Methyltransferase domain-containing protein n=1 Tax=Fluviispira multicolorata TaxID=2654512 RepID=A0A833N2B5_9BACT|nr:class I SAM-dependent methyltransferase [Fluviispira multicolorata]KAB8027997.1 methyltransferase domain-containing protein [Fluviispira multicolorata]
MRNFSSYFEFNPCIICKSNDFKVLKKSKYNEDLNEDKLLQLYKSSSDEKLIDQMVCCKECNLVYLNPRVKSNIILNSYTNSDDPTFFEQNNLRIRTFKKQLNKIVRTLSITPNKNYILDIGCAGGAFPKAAHDLGFKVIGIEPNKWLVNEGIKKYNIDLKSGILSDFNFQKENFNIITLWDVIEHLTNPEEVLHSISHIIKNDGYLLINYPDVNSLACKLMRSKWPFYLNVHLFYFNRKTINKFLDNCGFKVISCEPFWQTLELGYILKRASAYFKIFKIAYFISKKIKLDKIPFKYNLGQTFIIAQKKAGHEKNLE